LILSFPYLFVVELSWIFILNQYTMSKRLQRLLIGTVILLLIPLIGSQFSEEINWTTRDYVVAAAVLGGASFILDFALSKAKNKQSRWAWGIAVVLALALVWVELAVGLFGSPIAGS
jgi:glucose-6-phosphate-specific signal transduction histidine kinase